MEAKSFERKRTYTEKVIRKDKIVDEEVDDEVEEEDESGGGGGAQENKKIEVGRSGRRGSSGGFGVSLSPPSCQAERCGADLSDAKRYNRRHKVCELHSKAPVVMVAGLRQRFCQQCSRFHDVGEFDEAKRSCRRRLAEHNERRRKSVAETNYNDGSKSHHHHHPMESHRGRRVHQINISGSCASKSFHIK